MSELQSIIHFDVNKTIAYVDSAKGDNAFSSTFTVFLDHVYIGDKSIKGWVEFVAESAIVRLTNETDKKFKERKKENKKKIKKSYENQLKAFNSSETVEHAFNCIFDIVLNIIKPIIENIFFNTLVQDFNGMFKTVPILEINRLYNIELTQRLIYTQYTDIFSEDMTFFNLFNVLFEKINNGLPFILSFNNFIKPDNSLVCFRTFGIDFDILINYIYGITSSNVIPVYRILLKDINDDIYKNLTLQFTEEDLRHLSNISVPILIRYNKLPKLNYTDDEGNIIIKDGKPEPRKYIIYETDVHGTVIMNGSEPKIKSKKDQYEITPVELITVGLTGILDFIKGQRGYMIIQDDWDSWDTDKNTYGKLLISDEIPQVFFDDNKNDPIVLLTDVDGNKIHYNCNNEISIKNNCAIIKPSLKSILEPNYFNEVINGKLLELQQGGGKRKESKKPSKKKGSKRTSKRKTSKRKGSKKKGFKKTSKKKGSKRTSKRKTSKKTSKKKVSKKR